MARGRDLRAFLRASGRRRGVIFEAVWELIRARIDTLRPAEHYTSRLGRLDAEAAEPTDEQAGRAADIGRLVERVARWLPFKTLCLQQAIAVRRMLDRRGVPAVVYLGLAKEARGGQREAHAWVKTGPRVVSGDVDLARFAVVGVFS